MNKSVLNIILFIGFVFVSIGGCESPSTTATNNNSATIVEAKDENIMVHAKGVQLVDGNDRPVTLRGVLLEGWLMWNGTLIGGGLTSETKINNRLEQMAGKEQAEKFRTAIYDHFITEKDIELIAEFGFNAVRVPFNHTVLEDSNPLEEYTAKGWKYLDDLLEWCEKYKMYVILDFHSVPGGQGAFVSDPDLINVWFSAANQQKTVDIWKAIAKRYAKRQIIAGYDLINEPDAPNGKALVDLHRRIIAEIRKVDSLHMIILEGGNFSSDFSMYKTPLDGNQAYGFHTYNFFTDATDEPNVIKLSKLAATQKVPLLNGEFGAHNAKWVNDQIDLYENPKYPINGWIFWPWKRVSENSERYRHLGEILPNEEWKQVGVGISSLFGPSKEITPELTTRAMDNFVEATKVENLVFDQEMKEILKKHLND